MGETGISTYQSGMAKFESGLLVFFIHKNVNFDVSALSIVHQLDTELIMLIISEMHPRSLDQHLKSNSAPKIDQSS